MKNNSTTPVSIKVIAGSTREGRFSDKAAAWIAERLRAREGVAAEVLDLRDYPMPFFDAPVSPAYTVEPYTNEAVARFTAKIAEGDAFLIVAPEYNHGPTAVLKNALDWIYREWNNKPVAFVSYGSVGGARAVEQLRLVAIELQMAPIRLGVNFPGEKYFPVAFGKAPAAELFSAYTEAADEMIAQLLWWAEALNTARGK
mgnify:CR=1 FL=1